MTGTCNIIEEHGRWLGVRFIESPAPVYYSQMWVKERFGDWRLQRRQLTAAESRMFIAGRQLGRNTANDAIRLHFGLALEVAELPRQILPALPRKRSTVAILLALGVACHQ